MYHCRVLGQREHPHRFYGNSAIKLPFHDSDINVIGHSCRSVREKQNVQNLKEVKEKPTKSPNGGKKHDDRSPPSDDDVTHVGRSVVG